MMNTPSALDATLFAERVHPFRPCVVHTETPEVPLSLANLCLIGKYRHPHLMGVHLPSFRLSLFGRVERKSDNTLFQNIVASEGSRSSAVPPTFRPSWNHGRSKSPGREFPKRVASIDSWALTHCTMSWTMDILSPRLPLLSNSELQQMRTQHSTSFARRLKGLELSVPILQLRLLRLSSLSYPKPLRLALNPHNV